MPIQTRIIQLPVSPCIEFQFLKCRKNIMDKEFDCTIKKEMVIV